MFILNNFKDDNIMTFEDLNKYLTVVFMFKIKNGIFPEIMQTIFTTNTNIHYLYLLL